MNDLAAQYPKFLAFMQLFYPALYKQISIHSTSTDLVEANLICSNNNHSFQAIVYSEGISEKGELLDIYTGTDAAAPYSWDWRWVFAVKVLFAEKPIFKIKFKQKVIALPTGNHPLTNVFFDVLKDEFTQLIQDVNKAKASRQASIHKCFDELSKTIEFY